jgi:hypothetical protein
MNEVELKIALENDVTLTNLQVKLVKWDAEEAARIKKLEQEVSAGWEQYRLDKERLRIEQTRLLNLAVSLRSLQKKTAIRHGPRNYIIGQIKKREKKITQNQCRLAMRAAAKKQREEFFASHGAPLPLNKVSLKHAIK